MTNAIGFDEYFDELTAVLQEEKMTEFSRVCGNAACISYIIPDKNRLDIKIIPNSHNPSLMDLEVNVVDYTGNKLHEYKAVFLKQDELTPRLERGIEKVTRYFYAGVLF